jgi:fibronectin-binding autotransporter adhesin
MSRSAMRRFLVSALFLSVGVSVAAAQSTRTWTGLGGSAHWANPGNWDTGVPVSGDTGQFIDAGNGNTSIDLNGTAQPINTILFDTANAAAYTLGTGAPGDAFNFDASGAITVNSTVTNLETINAGIQTNGPLTVTVSSPTTAAGLTLAGVISGSGPVTINNVGNVRINGANTYTGGTSFPTTATQGQLQIGTSTVGDPGSITSGPFGTGTITTSSSLPQIFQPVGADRTIANAWDFNPGGIFVSNNTTVDTTPRSLALTGPINVVGGRTVTDNLLAGATLTLGSAASPSTITRSNTLTFQSQLGIAGANGGVLVVNDVINGSASNNTLTFQNNLKVTLNNTIGGNGNVTIQGTGTVAHLNKTGMYAGTGALTVQTGATAYFDQPNVLAGTGNFVTDGVGTTSYVNNPLAVGGTFNIQNDGVVYINAPTTYAGTAASAMNIQNANTNKQTALVVNSTLTRTGTATSAVRIATGTLAGNNGTIFAPVSVLTSTNGPSYLAPGSPLPSGGANTTPAYQNGAGLLTIGSQATPFNLDFNGTTSCSGCNFYAEIGGTTPGTQYDQVVVNGTATIGTATATRGTLTVSTINNFPTAPAADSNFEILKATTLSYGLGFTTVQLPTGWTLDTSSVPNSILVKVQGTGDFNGDHIVDAADYVTWRKDPNATPGGYDAWRRNFGNTVPGGGSGLGNSAVPEPAAIALVGLGLLSLASRRRGRRSVN